MENLPEFTLIPLLASLGLTIATAESCTGGLIAKRITDVPGASTVFPGGIVSYANAVKEGLLGVSPELLRQTPDAVSGEIAAEMARGICRATGADIGISTTGLAGPGGGLPDKPVGTVWLGLSCAGLGEETRLLRLPPDAGREAIRIAAADEALNFALAYARALHDRLTPDEEQQT